MKRFASIVWFFEINCFDFSFRFSWRGLNRVVSGTLNMVGDAFTETLLMPAFRVSTGLHVEHRRPKSGDAPHEGLLKVERRGFRCSGL